MSERLCVDCKHFRPGEGFSKKSPLAAKWGSCVAPETLYMVLLHCPGEEPPHCEIQRSDLFVPIGACGSDGRYWEPKLVEPAPVKVGLWSRLLALLKEIA